MDFDDFPVTPPQSQSPNWAGLYLGTHGAGGIGASGSAGWMNLAPTGPFSPVGTITPALSDSLGYNFQSGNLVFGLEGSLSAANFDGRFTSSYVPASGAWSPNMNWLGTVTGKVGYSFGQWLPYVKGGFVAADVGSPAAAISGFTQGTDRAGWTAGVGVEYQLSPKWSLGLEYLYTDLDTGGAPNSIGAWPDLYTNALKSQSLLGRLNYRAGW
ncbi:MAG TPA: outer membrane beta-barrel protein [Xanthobacteraceae bacterium]|nr:outer membrane beta-barrel protein [Xanthobacteraceae bacterium]